MSSVVSFIDRLPLWPVACAYLVLALAFAIVVRNSLRHWLDRAPSLKDRSARYDALVRAIPRPAGLAAFVLAIGLGFRALPLPEHLELLTKHVFPFVLATVGVGITMRVALQAIGAYAASYPQLESTARVITWVVGGAIVAVLVSDALGVSLAPALTALGVGSLSVALALQDTLSNFFSGVYLLIGRHIRPGDFIVIDGGHEGYVGEIGWRLTHLRTLAPSTVIVPNSTMSKAVIVNYGISNPRLLLATVIDVALTEDPVKAEAALTAVASNTTDIAGVLATPEPFVRLSLDGRGLAFTLYVTVNERADTGFVQQELRKRSLERLRRDNIALAPIDPFPS